MTVTPTNTKTPTPTVTPTKTSLAPVVWVYSSDILASAATPSSLAYSTEVSGTTWTPLGTSMFDGGGKDVAYDGNVWVAVGDGTNSIAYSYDGRSWTGLGASILPSAWVVRYENNMFVAASNSNLTVGAAYSYNGINWTGSTTSMAQIRALTYDDVYNKWFLGGNSGSGDIKTSVDGINWTGATFISGILAVYTLESFTGRTIAGGSGSPTMAYTDNGGSSWTAVPSSSTIIATPCNAIISNGNIWVAGGSNANTSRRLAYSYDGITWTTVSCTGMTINNLAWNGTVFLATGLASTGQSAMISSDGINWIDVVDSKLQASNIRGASNVSNNSPYPTQTPSVTPTNTITPTVTSTVTPSSVTPTPTKTPTQTPSKTPTPVYYLYDVEIWYQSGSPASCSKVGNTKLKTTQYIPGAGGTGPYFCTGIGDCNYRYKFVSYNGSGDSPSYIAWEPESYSAYNANCTFLLCCP
jgi:hypothetical protein